MQNTINPVNTLKPNYDRVGLKNFSCGGIKFIPFTTSCHNISGNRPRFTAIGRRLLSGNELAGEVR
jgi:hypothetical protein